MSLSFLRHCQSLFNLFNLSVPDVELSEGGKQHAGTITGKFDIVLCSPLKRAKQTLDLSQIKYDTLEVCPDIREELNGNVINYLVDEKVVAETDDQLEQRLTRLKEKLYDLTCVQGKHVLVVGHHGVFRRLTNRNFNNGEIVSVDVIKDE